MKAIATLLTGFLFLATASAQDEPPEEAAEEEIRRYTVEVIIFSYAENVAVGTEQFPPDEPVDDDGFGELTEKLDLVDELTVDAVTRKVDLQTYAKHADDLRFVLLGEEEFTLTNVIDQFDRLDVYETLMHFGWTQPMFPQEETEAIDLRTFGEPPERLDGSLTLYLSRYLHLVVDLALTAPDASNTTDTIDEPVLSFGDSRYRYDDEFGHDEPQVFYRIQENRIVRNGDVRYFDHPKFGVVAKVTRVEKEPDPPVENQ